MAFTYTAEHTPWHDQYFAKATASPLTGEALATDGTQGGLVVVVAAAEDGKLGTTACTMKLQDSATADGTYSDLTPATTLSVTPNGDAVEEGQVLLQMVVPVYAKTFIKPVLTGALGVKVNVYLGYLAR